MTIEQVFFVALLAVILLINAIARAVTARGAQNTAADRPPRTPEPPAPTRIRRRSPSGKSEPRRLLNEMAAVRLPTVTPPSPWSRGLPLRSLTQLRHGIVLMTVFGPCRGLDPHNPPE
jgi:hypothetical protein